MNNFEMLNTFLELYCSLAKKENSLQEFFKAGDSSFLNDEHEVIRSVIYKYFGIPGTNDEVDDALFDLTEGRITRDQFINIATENKGIKTNPFYTV